MKILIRNTHGEVYSTLDCTFKLVFIILMIAALAVGAAFCRRVRKFPFSLRLRDGAVRGESGTSRI
jgi:hypothetical protein